MTDDILMDAQHDFDSVLLRFAARLLLLLVFSIEFSQN